MTWVKKELWILGEKEGSVTDKRVVRKNRKCSGRGNGIRGDLIPDKIERCGQVVVVNSGPKRGGRARAV